MIIMSTVLTKITAVFSAISVFFSGFAVNAAELFCHDEGLIAKVCYLEFQSKAQKEFAIPAIDSGAVPQGICYCDELGRVLICGYEDSGEASKIFIVNPDSGECEKTLSVSSEDGEPYTGHAGGIAAFEGNVWLSSGSYARRIPVSVLASAQNGEAVSIVDKFNTGTRASYINCSNGILWVGEYHKKGDDYVTADEHHVKNADGDEFCAWTLGYALTAGSEKGFEYNGESKEPVAPDYILATESMCQGFTQLENGSFVTSISGSVLNSEINTYKNVLEAPADMLIEQGESKIPLWFLDGAAKTDSLTALPRSEGLDCLPDGRMLVLFESGCVRLKTSQLVFTQSVWSVDMK